MHKASHSIEDVLYCFPRSSIKCQGHTGHKNANFDPNLAFPDCNSQVEFPNVFEMVHKAWRGIEEVLYWFF